MRLNKFLIISLLYCIIAGCNTSRNNTHNIQNYTLSLLPRQIYCEGDSFHVQGVALDLTHGYAYFSFTTSLIKTDLKGNIIGSVVGMTGHLGCIDINPTDGRVYGSLEYKNDGIGKGIRKKLNDSINSIDNAFYIAIFNVNKISRIGMNAETDGILTTVYLKDVVDDYNATIENQGKQTDHRYGCSGIDGTAFGPQFGSKNDKSYLNIAYGIYGDTTRTDNDYQVLLQYDTNDLKKYEHPLSQNNIHQSGPSKPLNKYFVFTGNTNYGIQNLVYDKNTGYWFAAVYRGQKSEYPNYSLFTIDGSQKPITEQLKGFNNKKGQVLQLAKTGLHDPNSNIYGWEHKYGSTGIHSIGNGYFYISQNGVTTDKKQYCKLQLYHWTGQTPNPFEEVK